MVPTLQVTTPSPVSPVLSFKAQPLLQLSRTWGSPASPTDVHLYLILDRMQPKMTPHWGAEFLFVLPCLCKGLRLESLSIVSHLDPLSSGRQVTHAGTTAGWVLRPPCAIHFWMNF